MPNSPALALLPPAADQDLFDVACPGCPVAAGRCVVCTGHGRVLVLAELLDITGALERWRHHRRLDAAAGRIPMAARLQDNSLVAYGVASGHRYRHQPAGDVRHLTAVRPRQLHLSELA